MSSVDVIVPCYRYAHFLRECVRSVLDQPISDLRVLIIDDASPDNTAEVAADIARADSRVIFLRHITNKGHIATYNEGIEWASAKYMLILSADDYLLPGALGRSVKLMDEYPEVGFTFGEALPVSEHSTARNKIRADGNAGLCVLLGLEFIELSKADNLVNTATAVVRTELQKRLGGYRSELPHTGDLEMWLRFAAYASVGRIQAYQAVYRRHASNMSLKYNANMADLQQREAALACFFQTCSHVLPNCQRMQRRFSWSLGCYAVGFASRAFNSGDMEISEQLSDFALRVCPEVEKSLPWARLACKRRLGLRVWRILQPAAAGVREVVALVRRLVTASACK
jgi:hypothetical protein